VDTKDFQELIWHKGKDLFRQMPWRDDTQPYYVLVSELMLQQTQVHRVIPKFTAFMERFPTIFDLATAPLSEVLILWSGLGYNRRAKFLHQAARKVVAEHDGMIPDTLKVLLQLPGVGPSTAGAIMVYSYNQPVVFIETNVRTVYFQHLFPGNNQIHDSELRAIVEKTIDHEHPREWYWALMDYGSWLKKQGLGATDRSTQYKKQPPLKGSLREVRGILLKALAERDHTVQELAEAAPPDERFEAALGALLDEGLIVLTDRRLHLP